MTSAAPAQGAETVTLEFPTPGVQFSGFQLGQRDGMGYNPQVRATWVGRWVTTARDTGGGGAVRIAVPGGPTPNALWRCRPAGF